jgi:hypothetical protein
MPDLKTSLWIQLAEMVNGGRGQKMDLGFRSVIIGSFHWQLAWRISHRTEVYGGESTYRLSIFILSPVATHHRIAVRQTRCN